MLADAVAHDLAPDLELEGQDVDVAVLADRDDIRQPQNVLEELQHLRPALAHERLHGGLDARVP